MSQKIVHKPGLKIWRKDGESVIIGSGENEIEIIVDETSSSKCCIRIIAGKNVAILRKELQLNTSFFKVKEVDEFGKY